MSLTEYKTKRSFKRTPEPAGKEKEKRQPPTRKRLSVTKSSTRKALSFVIQKHKASHLHYDFRLEMGGVLKSWAIPKGPSMNPGDKRLAMLVEDHPIDYKDFEGIIPEGNYGAGAVIIWDEGTYELVNDKGVISDQREQEKMLIRNFFGGKLRFELKGKKLKGKFTLIKAAQRGENSWLLTKEKDQHAKQTDITKKDKSVISGKTIEELASRKPIKKLNSVKDVPKPTRAEKDQDDSPETGSRLLEKDGFLKQEEDSRDYLQIMAELLDELKEKKRSAAPKRLLPMLASSAKKAFDNPEWIYEIQWNGYRAIAAIHDEKVQLHSEENAVINKKFYPVHEALRQWLVNAIVDGEIVVVNEEGLSDKNQLDNWKTPEDGELIYYVFDLLWLNGYDLRHLPLQQRRNMLKRLVPEESGVRFSESFDAKGTEFFASAKKLGISGIVAKKKDSVYKAGIKTKSWLVIPTR